MPDIANASPKEEANKQTSPYLSVQEYDEMWKDPDRKDESDAIKEEVAKKIASSLLWFLSFCYGVAGLIVFTISLTGTHRFFMYTEETPKTILMFFIAIVLFLAAYAFRSLWKMKSPNRLARIDEAKKILAAVIKEASLAESSAEKIAAQKDAIAETAAKSVASSIFKIFSFCYASAGLTTFVVGAVGVYGLCVDPAIRMYFELPEILLLFLASLVLFLPAFSFRALAKVMSGK